MAAESFAVSPAPVPPKPIPLDLAAPPARDLRLDFFRGLLQLSIFIAHVPGNIAVLLLHRNFGWSDSSEIFVFASGVTLGSVFARKALRSGLATACRDSAARLARLYRRHVIVSLGFIGFVGAIGIVTQNPLYLDETGLRPLMAAPLGGLIRLLTLLYQPKYLDILPLFVVVTALVPLALGVPRNHAGWVLAASIGVYLLAQLTGITLPVWSPPGGAPTDGWSFNPFSWQLLFIAGTLIGRAKLLGATVTPRHRALLPAVLVFCLVAGVSSFSATLHYLIDPSIPTFLDTTLTPWLDKTNLSPLIVIHAFSVIYLVTRFFRSDQPFFASALARPVVECGRRSLDVFCVGLFVSFACHVVLVEVDGDVPMQLSVAVGGCLVLLVYPFLPNRATLKALIAQRPLEAFQGSPR